jgi:DNA-binding XRE family transcriptional regulator
MENNDLLFRIRTNIGLKTTEAAQLVHVTRRTWELWESGKAKVPAAKLELIKEKIERLYAPPSIDGAELVVVTMSVDGYDMPIDVVSSRVFCSLEENADGTYTIKSLAIDRYSKQPCVHCQRFSRSGNEHVIRAVKKWRSVVE